MQVHEVYNMQEDEEDTSWHFVMDLISPPPIRPGETRLTISGETVPLKMWSTDLLSYIKTNGTLNVQQARPRIVTETLIVTLSPNVHIRLPSSCTR